MLATEGFATGACGWVSLMALGKPVKHQKVRSFKIKHCFSIEPGSYYSDDFSLTFFRKLELTKGSFPTCIYYSPGASVGPGERGEWGRGRGR